MNCLNCRYCVLKKVRKGYLIICTAHHVAFEEPVVCGTFKVVG